MNKLKRDSFSNLYMHGLITDGLMVLLKPKCISSHEPSSHLFGAGNFIFC